MSLAQAAQTGYVATVADVEAELKRILNPLEIVVVNTSAGVKYGRPDYVASAGWTRAVAITD